MPSPPWFRFYSETLRDRKVERICRSTEQPKALVIGAWTTILAVASDSPIRGALLLTDEIPFTIVDLSDEMGLDLDTTSELLQQFLRFQMLHISGDTYHLTNWDKRQFESDSSTDRVRRHRERKKALQDDKNNGDETLQKRDGNLPEQSRADTDTEQKKKGPAPTPKPKRKPAPKNPPPPAVALYRGIAELYPKKSLWPDITDAVGDKPADLDRWEKICKAWVGMGWNPRNVQGMMEHFRDNRIPGDDRKGQPGNNSRPALKEKETWGT